jgi:hypothetical protein
MLRNKEIHEALNSVFLLMLLRKEAGTFCGEHFVVHFVVWSASLWSASLFWINETL